MIRSFTGNSVLLIVSDASIYVLLTGIVICIVNRTVIPVDKKKSGYQMISLQENQIDFLYYYFTMIGLVFDVNGCVIARWFFAILAI